MTPEIDSIIKATPQHIESVVGRIEEIRKGVATKFLELGNLLGEFKDGGFHVSLGFQNFGAWLKQSGLDMGESQAYYLIKITRTAKELGIPNEQLEKVKLSKLREICRLDTKTHGKQIKQLIDACTPNDKGEEMSLEDVRINVQKVEAGVADGEDTKIDIFVFMTIKVTQSAKQVIEDAVELIRAQHGDTAGPDGEPQDISIGRAIELMAAETLNGVDAVSDDEELRRGPFGDEEAIPVEGTRVTLSLPEHIGPDYNAPLGEEQGAEGVAGSTEPDHDASFEEMQGELQPFVLPTITDAEQETLIDEFANPPKQVPEGIDLTIDHTFVEPEPEIHVMPLDVPAVTKRVAADLAAGQSVEDDPLLEDARKMAAEEFDATTSAAVGALALTRRFRIGTARALNLFNKIKVS